MAGDAKSFVDEKIASGKKVVVFSKTTCPYCTKAKKVLGSYSLGDQYEVVEINTLPNMSEIQDYLAQITGARSVPRVFINGKSIGGCDDTVAAHTSGKLKALLA